MWSTVNGFNYICGQAKVEAFSLMKVLLGRLLLLTAISISKEISVVGSLARMHPCDIFFNPFFTIL